jgi:hypothetical protein
MALTLTMDVKAGMEIDHAFVAGTRLLRPFYIRDIPANATGDPVAFLGTLYTAGLPQFREAHPATGGLRVTRHIIRTGENTNDAAGFVVYEGPSDDGQIEALWVIEDRSTLTQEMEEIDQDGRPIQVIFESTRSVTIERSSGPATYTEPVRHPFTAGVPVLRPRRILSVSGIIKGRPGEAILDALGSVNQNTWQGKDPGYWLCVEASAAIQLRSLSGGIAPEDAWYRVRAEFMSKVRRDWSSFAVYRTPYGHIPKELSEPGETASRLAVINGPYSTGQDNTSANGFAKVGMYPFNDFLATFGF